LTARTKARLIGFIRCLDLATLFLTDPETTMVVNVMLLVASELVENITPEEIIDPKE
jgi:hypothetical protein